MDDPSVLMPLFLHIGRMLGLHLPQPGATVSPVVDAQTRIAPSPQSFVANTQPPFVLPDVAGQQPPPVPSVAGPSSFPVHAPVPMQWEAAATAQFHPGLMVNPSAQFVAQTVNPHTIPRDPEALRLAAAALNAVSPQVETQTSRGVGSQAMNRALRPQVWEDVCTGKRNARTCLYDCEQYAQDTKTSAVTALTRSLKGHIRDKWQIELEKTQTAMSWEDAKVAFSKLVGADLIDQKHEATLAMLQLPPSTCMKPSESVSGYSIRFRDIVSKLGVGSLSQEMLVRLYCQGLTETFRHHLSTLNGGKPLETLDLTIKAATEHARTLETYNTATKARAAPMHSQYADVFEKRNEMRQKQQEYEEEREWARETEREARMAALPSNKRPFPYTREPPPPPPRARRDVMGYANVPAARAAFKGQWMRDGKCIHCGSPDHMIRKCDASGPLGAFMTPEEKVPPPPQPRARPGPKVNYPNN